MKVMDLQERIGRGEYQVDAHVVADAILRRLLAERELRAADVNHQP